MVRSLARISAGAAVVLCASMPVVSAADFYAGKTIEVVVGTDVGGGYDVYARAIARHLGRHIPGNPMIVVRNMPGAGSARAAVYTYGVAAKDGTVIGALFPGVILSPLLDERPEASFDPTKFTYLGTADSGTRVCATFQGSKTRSFEDALTVPTRMGATAVGASTRDYVLFLRKTTDVKFELVMGYRGSAEILLAMERGEIDGLCGWDWSSFKSQKPDWLRDGKANVLLQVSIDPHPELTKMGVPTVFEFVRDTEARKVVELVISQTVFHRSYIAPPGTPPALLETLRTAFDATMNDKAVLEDADKLRLDIAPLSGARVQELVTKLYATPKDVVERARKAIRQ
jgi:tripartite-type tricarboxylate transporter receptor subunit TctC